MSIRWIKNVVIDGVKSTIEIQIGDQRIGDKCYTRVNNEVEQWFRNASENREAIIEQGIGILRRRLVGKKVAAPDGTSFEWK